MIKGMLIFVYVFGIIYFFVKLKNDIDNPSLFYLVGSLIGSIVWPLAFLWELFDILFTKNGEF